jgi:ATP-dependent Lon protease
MMKADESGAKDVAKVQIPEELPILPSGGEVIYPSMVVPLAAADEKTVRLINDVVAGNKLFALFAQRPGIEEPPPANLYNIGTVVTIARMLKMPDGSMRALLQGLVRVRLVNLIQSEPYLRARVEVVEERVESTTELEAMHRNLLSLFQKVVQLAPNLPDELSVAATNMAEPGELADFIAAHLNLSLEEKQENLELLDVSERIKKLTALINRELEILELGTKIQSQIKGEMGKVQREFYLREQLKAIQRELGESDERTMEINELKHRIEEAKLPQEARKEAERELERLSKMPPQAAEYTVSRTYLDWLITLPWAVSTEDNLDIEQAKMVLDEDHYNLDKVKERILDYLAVRKLKEDMKGPILCFIGPPGTGKTSVGQSIARALGRKFIRLSLGGIRDEAEIRGFRRTYVGSLPGRIIQGMRHAGSNNPVFMLDEVDKIGADFRGDPAAALLEVLDPEQNFAFSDHYLDVPFDLSKVMFITTANITDPIPPALKDRMEVLELPGYTEAEKLHIAKRFLIPKQLKENGLSLERLKFSDDALLAIIRNYTREAGLRNLEREIGAICRKVARKAAQGVAEETTVEVESLEEFLGPSKFRYEVTEGADEVGVATGLAWTPAGGDILFIEAVLVPGKGDLTLTGSLGEVMQESAKAALTYTRSLKLREEIKPVVVGSTFVNMPVDFYEKNDVHIHVPAGAIPKDGPSAGIAMAVALISALSKRPVRKEVAMSGEITLRGKLLPVGGIKEKVLAAHRAGVKKVVLPKDNEKDLSEVPQQVRDELKFIFAESIDEALEVALAEPIFK